MTVFSSPFGSYEPNGPFKTPSFMDAREKKDCFFWTVIHELYRAKP